MDYSPKRRIVNALTMTALMVGLTGCPPENQGTGGGAQVQSADALYRQGRAIEDRVAGSDVEARANLQQARTTYIQALHASPSAALEPRIHAGLGNVAFYQDDYATAVSQWSAAYPGLDDPQAKSMTLLRMGMAQQRLGRFDLADQSFATLQQQFPQSDAARVARTKAGARQFYVQVAVFQQTALADKAIAQLRKDGLAAGRTTDAQGRQVVRVGPFLNYAQAQQAKGRLGEAYKGAIINP